VAQHPAATFGFEFCLRLFDDFDCDGTSIQQAVNRQTLDLGTPL
jgi:hypothetical protein